jgi:hypothetical protein
MTQPSWKVPVVKLTKNEVVVDLGGGHLVNLVDLQKKITIDIEGDKVYFNAIQSDQYAEDQLKTTIYSLVEKNKVNCIIPFVSESNIGGGRQSHRRPPRRRVTRRLTRRRRV